jgi:ribosomal protein S27AE
VRNAKKKLQEEKNKMPSLRSLQDVEAEGTKKCPECGSTDIEKHNDEIYCKKCGLVLD